MPNTRKFDRELFQNVIQVTDRAFCLLSYYKMGVSAYINLRKNRLRENSGIPRLQPKDQRRNLSGIEIFSCFFQHQRGQLL